ncbi:MAG TPA: hypothetical protein VN688_31500 [Gemmataceae bacterium]|nr:hypothetical protein [Gemmataceae bacterium]
MGMTGTISLKVKDPTEQQEYLARNIPIDAEIGEVLAGLTRELNLPANDLSGRPCSYGVRARGESLPESDRIGNVLCEGDTITLMQNVTAG